MLAQQHTLMHGLDLWVCLRRVSEFLTCRSFLRHVEPEEKYHGSTLKSTGRRELRHENFPRRVGLLLYIEGVETEHGPPRNPANAPDRKTPQHSGGKGCLR